MHDDLDLMQLASTGQKLARLDATDYLAVHVVLAWAAAGIPTLYCAYGDWATTPVARLAAKDAELAELAAGLERYAAEAVAQAQRAEAAEARAAEMERRLAAAAAPDQTPIQNQTAMLKRQSAYLNAADETPPVNDPGPCPDCGETGWKSTRALQMHRQRAHQGMQAFNAKPTQFVEDLGWKCAAKGCAGAHARSMTDPAFCTLHAAPRANGVEITA